ncbi:mechanosensitive ion channel domain-containing protein [Pelomonas sp. SE-A7]|uniref:mechanosensitive ion channel family protein n=1 Tax=Pelomonas sp. SE-A7 TaxID=3054953 RepID=UPI00259D11C6|nr:mechanosensitive ion channel domain-containing protein [Pelomonas sp. SE-A7]MDM4765666.1 mechanosensitive ion channel [Pelomonas sp. SE-A7]
MNRPLSFDELQALGAALLKPAALTELGLLLGALALAWLLVWRLGKSRMDSQQRPLSVLFGRHVVDGVLFPLLALLLALGARRLVMHWGLPLALFKLAVPVLISLLAIRFTVRVLTVALPESNWVKLVERFVSWVAWLGSVLWITGLWPALMQELEDISWKVGGKALSLRSMLEGGLTAAVVLVISLWISSIIEARLLRNVTTDLSLRKIAVNLTRAVLLLVGLLLALSAAGIDITALGVLGGALGVGIGFGLQKLAANYVSGFVILAERSLRIGDMVKVDGFEGRISDIKTRYTVIRALNGREAIIPNETLITTRVENSSLADPQVLLTTLVQVAYGCDVEQVMAKLAEAVGGVERVLASPAPAVQLSSFAADGLELTVSFWISDPQNGQGGVRSDVNLTVLKTLAELGVEIPYPQRVLHQRTATAP